MRKAGELVVLAGAATGAVVATGGTTDRGKSNQPATEPATSTTATTTGKPQLARASIPGATRQKRAAALGQNGISQRGTESRRDLKDQGSVPLCETPEELRAHGSIFLTPARPHAHPIGGGLRT